VIPGRGLAVRCAHPTVLLVRRVQLEGKAAQAAADFANGLRMKQLALGT
jgi:methionyl-tRNA formyltransferase